MYERLHLPGSRLTSVATRLLALIFSAVFLVAIAASAQGQTSSFTYQGRLTDGGTAANGHYDLQFVLWDSLSGGTQIGATQTLSNVSVSSGVFSVSLDFGAAAFPGANRFVEISTRLAGAGTFTLLTPREQITSTPYAIRSSNATLADSATSATQLAGVDSSQFVQTSDSRLSDSRTPTSGSSSYVQNATVQQASSNFNISGDGTAGGTLSGNVVNATTQYNVGNSRVLTANAISTSVGVGAGSVLTGLANSFFGTGAGNGNSTGGFNSFFGSNSGSTTTTGGGDSFFGTNAGSGNTGSGNSFFGLDAGHTNTTGNNNSVFGFNADVAGNNFTNATAIGALAQVNQSNSLVLGSINGVHGAGADTNVGIGTTTPGFKLDVAGDINTSTQYNIGGSRVLEATSNNTFVGVDAGSTLGQGNSFFGNSSGFENSGNANSFFGHGAGAFNTTGQANSFFGSQAGQDNHIGQENSFFGGSAGLNTNADGNAFFGTFAGFGNQTGTNNTAIGRRTNLGNGPLTNATAIGALAQVDQSNSLVLGSISGVNGATFDTKVGIGTTAPTDKLTVKTAGGTFGFVHTAGAVTVGSFIGGSTGGGWYGTKSNHSLSFFVNSGGPSLTINTDGTVTIATLGTAGPTALCINGSNQISSCSSSLRYKTNLALYRGGMDVINRLRPITFDWKDGGKHDVGFGAEDVAKIDPLLVTYNARGQVEGVKYDRISVVLTNALKQQQTQIETLETANAALNARLQAVEKLLLKKPVLSCRRCR